MADFLVGRAFRYDELDKAIIGKYRWYNLESFGQDQIKLRPNLTLTLGMRYSYFQSEWEKSNLINVFLPSAYDHSKAPVVNPDGTIPPRAIPRSSKRRLSSILSSAIRPGPRFRPAPFSQSVWPAPMGHGGSRRCRNGRAVSNVKSGAPNSKLPMWGQRARTCSA